MIVYRVTYLITALAERINKVNNDIIKHLKYSNMQNIAP